jgi:hypothetical protein
MEFTTRFRLHSQAARLYESTSYDPTLARDRILTFSDTPFQGILAPSGADGTSPDYNSGGDGWPPDFRRELCPLHSPLLGASLLVSFPPLSDMLKFSG